MALYDVLANKPCIWILKLLYDQETSENRIYTMKLSKIGKITGLNEKASQFVLILSKNGLLHIDDIGDDKVVCLTQKGKDFFKQFDRLKIILEGKKETKKERMVRIEYNLTDLEKRTLIMIYKLSKEIGEVTLKTLVQEMYPYDNYSSKYQKLNKSVNRLMKLNLIIKIKRGKIVNLALTDAGKRTIKEQLIANIAQQFE